MAMAVLEINGLSATVGAPLTATARGAHHALGSSRQCTGRAALCFDDQQGRLQARRTMHCDISLSILQIPLFLVTDLGSASRSSRYPK